MKKIVLTGGPCGGKSTAKNYLMERLMDWGLRPFWMPEIASMFITGGVYDIDDLAKNRVKKYLGVQRRIILAQVALRHEFEKLAQVFQSSDKTVLFFDRAEMDALAYMPKDIFFAILEEEKLSLKDVRDAYDLVIHLVTAAKGAESFYIQTNNSARRESLDEAILQDTLTLNAWNGCRKLKIIDNSTDFEGKMKRTLRVVANALGIPVPLEIERKFLIDLFLPDFNNPIMASAQKIFIEQMYLVSSTDEEIRIRKREQNGHSSYFKTTKSKASGGVRFEIEVAITPTEYVDLQINRNFLHYMIQKYRYCFSYKNQYFELDCFITPKMQIILEIELTDRNDKIEIPPFLEPLVIREVTDDPNYSNYEISKIHPA